MTAAALRIDDTSRPGAVFLRRQPWFAALDAAQQQAVADACYTVAGRKGQVLLRAGEPVKAWYAVLDGLVKLQGESAQGRRHCFLGIPGGEWFGEGSVMKKEPRMYDVIALRDTELLCLPRAGFEELRGGNLRFCQFLNEQFNMRLGQAMAIIEAMRLRTPAARVAMYLGPQLWHGSRKLSLSQEELGLLAALSRQTVNAVLKEFERQGLVSLEFGRVGILDEAGLAAIVAGG
jgi:CRP/FNR family cyclic AMP-dependent transcriptional regulator